VVGGDLVTKWEPKSSKETNALFRRLMDQEVPHVRLGQRRGDETYVSYIGTLAELHGPDGQCRCCPRRAS
jgi:hypothetical protein